VAASSSPSRSTWLDAPAPRFGVVIPQGWRGDLEHVDGAAAQFEAMVSVAREAELLGFDSVWIYDHFQSGERTTFEAWTSLAAVARETSRVRLGQLVTCTLYRNPALLAKMAATLDAASGGRCLLGLGGGWDDEEYTAYGYPAPFPPIADRLRMLGEAAAVVRALADGGPATAGGETYRVREAHNVPGARVPLLIGGNGERVLLRLVAEHADACNLTDSLDPAFYTRKLGALRRHCEAVGRDDAEILKTATFTVSGGEPGLAETLAAVAAAGIEYFILYFERPADLEGMRRFASGVMPLLRP
jgi:alkanesulfonate monooxygenase SsuD/methylene tetrahydromethanopterin reductase-like flavin-dependent oxidoreductase (luciferase family)